MSIDTIITAVRARLVDCKSDTPLVRLEDLERENGLDFLEAMRSRWTEATEDMQPPPSDEERAETRRQLEVDDRARERALARLKAGPDAHRHALSQAQRELVALLVDLARAKRSEPIA